MRRHKDGLYRFARRYTGNADEAYEVVQLSFISAWKALARFETGRAFDVWLRAIALNKCRDRARRAKVRRLVFGSPPEREGDAPEPPSQAPGPDVQVSDRDALRAAEAAIAALPDGLKAPLILTSIDGLTMAEAAQVLGMTAKAVENRLYRARKALAEALGGPDG
ncbi:RNA polymerase sigma factor [Glycocaulis profundi]|nr:RNA polymerase sigma factor [Glycocaulis profundi]